MYGYVFIRLHTTVLYVFIKLHIIIAQSGPVILMSLCLSHWSSQEEGSMILMTQTSDQTDCKCSVVPTVKWREYPLGGGAQGSTCTVSPKEKIRLSLGAFLMFVQVQ